MIANDSSAFRALLERTRLAWEADWVVSDETGWRVGGYPAWLHTLVGSEATACVIDPTRSGAVAEAILGLDYAGTMIHDGWSPYDQFKKAGPRSSKDSFATASSLILCSKCEPCRQTSATW
jgi:hypothetical protein